MGTKAFVLENKQGQTVRYLHIEDDKLFVIYRLDNRRVEFVESLEVLDAQEIPYDLLHETTVSDIKKTPYEIGKVGILRYTSEIDYHGEVEPTKEDDKAYPVILKWTSVSTVMGLGFVFVISWMIGKWFAKAPEPIVVQVFEQEQLKEIKKQMKTVEVSEKLIKPTKKYANMTKKAKKQVTVTTNASQNGKVKGRPGANMNQMGALGVLGGMGKNFNGSGGLNLNATKNNPGIAYGGMAAAGGLDKGLIGKGMIASGIGKGGNPRGFGGYGTAGRGGGKPGYGNMSMAGSSAGYFEPLGEPEFVEGGLDRDQINAVVQRHIGQIIYCYEQGLQSKPSLSGRVSVKFVISGSGSVSTAKLAGTSLGSSNVESCILGKLRGWQFPKPVGHVNVRVTYPFTLKRMSQG